MANLSVTIGLAEMLPQSGRGSKDGYLPDNFWETLPFDDKRISFQDTKRLNISADTQQGALNVRLRRFDLKGKTYHIIISNNEVAIDSLSSSRPTLEEHDFIVSIRTYSNFERAAKTYEAAVRRLNELGY